MAEEKKNGQTTNGAQQDMNQLLKIRRDKLKQLIDDGKNPFEITKYDVTHHTEDIKEQYEALKARKFQWPDVSCQNVSWVKRPSATSRI